MKPLPAPWDRIFRLGTRSFVWGSIAGIIYVLRPFFLLVFLTFVFAYIQSHAVDGLGRWIRNRPARVVLVMLVFLGALVGVGSFVVPHIKQQAVEVGRNYKTILQDVDESIRSLGKDKEGLLAPLAEFDSEATLKSLLGIGDESSVAGTEAKGEERLKRAAAFLMGVGSFILAVAGAFLLSLLFSFLIVLDLPRLTAKTKALAYTKIGWIYEQVADGVYSFAKVLGRALEAQFFIAVVNTILTAAGLYALSIPHIVVLSTIVFFCSFIPVAGVFLSSTPMCLIALQEYGFTWVLLVVGMVLLVHTVEAYILNPMIYGHHMRMNPVLVLIILTIGGKLFGIWGLVLGIPVMNYVFGHAIRYPERSLPDDDRAQPAKSA